eukprot:TRINITY_DN40287_c0_g1_i1.p1 TRINITY_DN40287_c0_g1~~TRINITY_DN40287_c0_g1_i1.p1  ORF type:complete len:372 (-),score=55.36 TRINITY_DN40287_c0_g1_i1:92-1150(-)
MDDSLHLEVSDVTATERQHCGQITGIALVGNRVLLAGEDKRLLGFEPLPRGPLRLARPELRAPHSFEDMRATLQDDRSKVIIVAATGSCCVSAWSCDRQSGDEGVQHHELNGHSAAAHCVDVERSFALSGSDDGTARLWDVQGAREILALNHRVAVSRALFFSGCVATLTEDGVTNIWDLRENARRPICAMQDASAVNPFEDPDSRMLAVGRREGRIATLSRSFEVRLFEPLRCGAKPVQRIALPLPACTLDFAMDDRYIVASGKDGDICSVRWRDLASEVFDVQEVAGSSANLARAPAAASSSAVSKKKASDFIEGVYLAQAPHHRLGIRWWRVGLRQSRRQSGQGGQLLR